MDYKYELYIRVNGSRDEEDLLFTVSTNDIDII